MSITHSVFTNLREIVDQHDITKRLPENQRVALCAQLGLIQARELEELCHAKTWDQPIFKNPQLPYYALKAFFEKFISISLLCTILMYWDITNLEKNDVKFEQIFDSSGEINVRIKNKIEGTFNLTALQQQQPSSWLTDSQKKEFFQRLSQAHPLERVCITFKNPYDIGFSHTNLRQRLASLGFNVFSHLGNKQLMSLNYAMMDAFLGVLTQNAVTIRPVLGESPWQDFCDPSQRIIAFPFPGAPLPENADGFPSEGAFTFHDFYHCCVCSRMGQEIREVSTKTGLVVHEMLGLSPSENRETLEKLRNFLLDMDYGIKTNYDGKTLWSLLLTGSVSHIDRVFGDHSSYVKQVLCHIKDGQS